MYFIVKDIFLFNSNYLNLIISYKKKRQKLIHSFNLLPFKKYFNRLSEKNKSFSL